MIRIKGWAEISGRRLSHDEICEIVQNHPNDLKHFGGEFVISWNNCVARDLYGVMPGSAPRGVVTCNGRPVWKIEPDPPAMDLEQAIIEAVLLRSDKGVVAFSGGVDSALIAAIAGLPAVTVGIEGSHDLQWAKHAASLMKLEWNRVLLCKRDVEEALHAVIRVIPEKTPLDTSIATTQYCIGRWAIDQGHERILCGQGADEQFAGYDRYLRSPDPAAAMEKDFEGLERQLIRDQTVMELHNCRLSVPYLDVRVVRAAQQIPVAEKLCDGVRKRPLREVAERHIPREIAWQEKKAMQYGSGVWKVIQKLARENGYKRSVQEFLNQLKY